MTEKKPDHNNAIVIVGDRSLSAPRLKLISRGLEITESLEKLAQTVVRDIIVEIDYCGFLRRRAILDSVRIEGKPISDVYLGFVFNENKMSPERLKHYDIRIGDTINIESIGGFITVNKEVVTRKRTGNGKILTTPAKCPACGSKIETLQPDSAYYCTGTDCPGRIKAQVMAFCDSMHIGLNPELVKELVYKRIISDSADLYFLKKMDLMRLNEMDEDSVQLVLDAIEKSRHPKLANIIIALLETGGFSLSNAIDVAYHCNSIDDLFDAESLDRVKSFYPIKGNVITIFMNDANTLKFIEKLKKGGVVFPHEE